MHEASSTAPLQPCPIRIVMICDRSTQSRRSVYPIGKNGRPERWGAPTIRQLVTEAVLSGNDAQMVIGGLDPVQALMFEPDGEYQIEITRTR